MSKGRWVLEGISAHRVLSRGYPDRGAEMAFVVLASRNLPDGTAEIGRFHVKEPEGLQTAEQHVARSAFLFMFNQYMKLADDEVIRQNTNEKKKGKKRARR